MGVKQELQEKVGEPYLEHPDAIFEVYLDVMTDVDETGLTKREKLSVLFQAIEEIAD